MSSNSRARFHRTLWFRLTVRFAVLFTGLSIVVFLLLDMMLRSNFRAQVEEDLRGDVEEFVSILEEDGVEGLQSEFDREVEFEGSETVYLALLSPDRTRLAGTDPDPWPEVGVDRLAGLGPGDTRIRSIPSPEEGHSALLVEARLDDGRFVQRADSLREIEELVGYFRRLLGAALLVMLASGFALGWFVTRRVAGEVDRVTDTATRIAAGDLSLRVPVGNQGEEIRRLGLAFNEMLARIEMLMRELKEVTNNVAHDLRSPVTRIRGMAETTLTGDEDLDEYQGTMAAIVGECDRLIGMVNTMLEISEANSGGAGVAGDAVDMSRLLRDAHEVFMPVAEEKGVTLRLEIGDGPAKPFTTGSVAKLQRALANIIDNAIKYTPRGGEVRIGLASSAGRLKVTVADTGCGIEPEDLPRVFERFFRADESRSTPGYGLGLSLAQAIVRAHGGAIGVESEPGRGSRFAVDLPPAGGAVA